MSICVLCVCERTGFGCNGRRQGRQPSHSDASIPPHSILPGIVLSAGSGRCGRRRDMALFAYTQMQDRNSGVADHRAAISGRSLSSLPTLSRRKVLSYRCLGWGGIEECMKTKSSIEGKWKSGNRRSDNPQACLFLGSSANLPCRGEVHTCFDHAIERPRRR